MKNIISNEFQTTDGCDLARPDSAQTHARIRLGVSAQLQSEDLPLTTRGRANGAIRYDAFCQL